MELARKFSRAAKPYASSSSLRVLFFLVVAGQRTDAHKPVTSKYDYNKDIFPLLQDSLCALPR